LKWHLILNEQMKNHGYKASYDMVMNLAQAMLAGRSLEAFLNEQRAQEAKKTQGKGPGNVYPPPQNYDCAIFELAIRAFEIQRGWRDAYEREREYMRKDLFMGKLNPEKFSQRLQDLNKYLDYIPIKRTTLSDKTIKEYGKSLPEDEIRSIMGQAIPPEWTVNLLALGKEPWRFKDLEDRLNMYRQQWQAYQQKQIIEKMVGKMPGKKNKGKRKNCERNRQNSNGGHSSTCQGNISREDAEDAEEAEEDAAEEETTTVRIFKMLNVSIVAKMATILPTAQSQEKMTMNSQTWYPSRISKNLSQSSLKERTNKQRIRKTLKAMMNLWT
jgi:hypothetical protein